MGSLKKVLFINEVLWLGGAERILIDTVNYLSKSGYKITVCTLLEEAAPFKYLNRDIAYRYVYARIKSGNNMLSIIRSKLRNKLIMIFGESNFCKLLFSNKYDYIISFKGSVSANLVNKLNDKKAKTIAWFHSDASFVDFGSNLGKHKEIFSKFDKIVCVSQACKKAFDLKFGLNDKTVVAYNPLDEKAIINKSREYARDILEGNGRILCSVGRLDKLKRFDRLLKIHKRLLEQGIFHRLVIIGEGEEKDSLRKYIEENKLCDTAILLGHMDNPYPYIAKSDLFVFSSETEAYCTAIIEALILGKPVVTTDCGGMREILGDSEYGLITANNTESLYEGIKRVLCDRKLYEYFKDKASERSAIFTMDKRIREIQKLLC